MSSIKLPSTELSKSDQNLAINNSKLKIELDKLSVQTISKPHSVHSLNDVIIKTNDVILKNEDIVKSDSQLDKLDDNFISLEVKIDKNDLNKSLENLKQNSLDFLEITKSSNTSLSKASLNNLLIDERSFNGLSSITPDNTSPPNTTPATNTTPLNRTSSSDKTSSSLVELRNITDQQLKKRSKQSTGSIDFIPNWSSSFALDSNRINVGLEDEMIVEGYSPSYGKQIIYYLGVFFTIGLLLIYCETKLPLKIRLTHRKSSLKNASVLILIYQNGDEFIERVIRQKNDDDDDNSNDYIHFYHKKLKYIWNLDRQQFIRLTGLESEKCAVIYSYATGLTHQEAEDKFDLYGSNSIHIDVQPVWKIVVESLKNPFYVYQAFIVIAWCVQLYYQFAFCVFTFSVITLALEGYETRKQNKLLRSKVQSESQVTVIRSSCAQTMSSNKLVVGDLLVLNKPCHLNCDAVLIEGTCTVNESMLTGECVPIAKSALKLNPDAIYSPKSNKKNTLYCGTEILQVQASDVNSYAKAIVVRTGYSTAKGELVRAILFPKESNALLNADLVKCMKMFFVLGIPCMFYTAWTFSSFGVKTIDLILVVIDVATFLIPPLLPSVMTSINVHAQKRLLKKDIFCLNASCINACGILDTTVFDKTGTITEDSLDFASALPALTSDETELIDKFLRNKDKEDENLNEIKNHSEKNLNMKSHFSDEAWTYLKDKELNNLIMTVGCCHSLIYFDNKIVGDILDLKMFEQLKDWKILNNQIELDKLTEYFPNSFKLERIIKTNIDDQKERIMVGIVKEFQFESNLQRMMVIAKPIIYADNQIESNTLNNNNYLVLSKGAPEKIEKFCKPETIPSNYNEILYSYTVQGFRVIACASKVINLSRLENLNKLQITDFEDELTFDGLVVFHNKIKRQSKPTIEELRSIDMRCLMATGDNLLTAVNVSRNCGLIDQDEQVIELKAELVTCKLTNQNAFIGRDEYVEYLDNEQVNEDKQIKLTYKMLRNPNQVQHHHLTKLFRKESHHNDQDEVIINMLDNKVMKHKKESTSNQLKLFDLFRPKKSDQKIRLNNMINDLDNERKSFYLCCEGPTFQLLKYHNEKVFNYLTHKGVVFARMSPNQKEQLIRSLQEQEHICAMVGDGANDCAALRNANCGLSLSSEESAVAAAFSTSHTNISVFKYLICEGKATISATFGAFKYQVSYCFVLLAAVLLLFYDGAFPSDLQYIVADIVLNIAPPMVFGTTEACYKLVKRKPNSILFGFSTLFSIFSFVIIQTSFYFFARYLITQQIWYEPFKFEKDLMKVAGPSHVVTTIFSVNMMSYIISAIVFSPGHPFRKSVFSNKLYMAVVLLNLLIVLSLSFFPIPKSIIKLINFKEFPEFSFKVYLLLINIVNFIISYFWEIVLLQNLIPAIKERYFSHLNWNRKIKIYEKLDHELSTNNWPPILFDFKHY